MAQGQPVASTGRLVSRYADEPEMAALVTFFVEEMPARIQAIESAWSAGERRLLGRLVHQLRGAGAGYGFPEVGEAAGRVEAALTGGAPEGLAALDRSVRELIELCERACAAR